MASNTRNSTEATVHGIPRRQYKWYVVAMLWLICFFNYADRQAIFSVFPILESEFGFTKAQLGWIGSAFAIVYALGAPLGGQVGDFYPRKWIILGGLYVWSLVTGFTAGCTRFWHFVLVRGAEGFGETFYFPASMSLVSDYHSPRTRSTAMAIHQTSVYAGTIGGGFFAGLMAQYFGWRSPFLILGIAGIVLGLVLSIFLREPKRDEQAILDQELDDRNQGKIIDAESSVSEKGVPLNIYLAELLHKPSLILLLLAFGFANSVGMVFLTWMPTFLKEKMNMNLALAGLSATIYIQLASALGSLLSGYLADWLSLRTIRGRVLVQSAATFLASPFIFYCGTTTDNVAFAIAMTGFGFFKGFYDANIWAAMFDLVKPSRRGTTLGLGNCLGWLCGSATVILIGNCVDAGWTLGGAISSTAGLYVITSMILLTAGFFIAGDRAKMTREID